MLTSLLLCIATSVSAQGYPFSQRASVGQTIALTEVSITYGRPVARGRALFGALIPWDSIWHPGADSASLISISHDVLVEGKDLKAGEYSLWLIPHASSAWTLIFNRTAHTFHKPYPGSATEALRVDVMPEQGAHMETLAFYFPIVLRDEATLRFHWGTTQLPIRIKAPYRPDSDDVTHGANVARHARGWHYYTILTEIRDSLRRQPLCERGFNTLVFLFRVIIQIRVNPCCASVREA